MSWYQHDNFGAFNNEGIKIRLANPEDEAEVSKAVVVFNNGLLVKEFEGEDLVWPLVIKLTEEESATLPLNVFVNLVVFDTEGREKTCDGVLKFQVKSKVLKGCCCYHG